MIISSNPEVISINEKPGEFDITNIFAPDNLIELPVPGLLVQKTAIQHIYGKTATIYTIFPKIIKNSKYNSEKVHN